MTATEMPTEQQPPGLQLSAFGERVGGESGISVLMDDLGAALEQKPAPLLMGGGNPGQIEPMQAFFAGRLQQLLEDRTQRHALLGLYQAPQGDAAFRAELATYLCKRYGWAVDAQHIALANGSQSAFFVLFNLFAGEMSDGRCRRIHLPLSPEYVGYRDSGLARDFFSATAPRIETLENGEFKYHLDLSAQPLAGDAGALCISRPSNPTGNVISDAELASLDAQARAQGIPLIIDGAYGLPFPGLFYGEATALWNPNTVLMLSLSKLGLPGLRTGIIVARPEIAQAFARANTVLSLACGNMGPRVLGGLLADGRLDRLCREELLPYYRERRALALAAIAAGRGDLPVRVHRAEGAFFLWLWCEGLPIDSMQLYQRLKVRGLIVLPGNDFFIATDPDWRHSRECLRISYAGDKHTIEAGIALLMDELHKVYQQD